MRPMLVRVFDLLFVVAWAGFVIIIVWIFSSLLSTISEQSFLPILIPGTGTCILLVTAVLWIGLFIAALIFSYREDRLDQFRNCVWRRILFIHFLMLTGPTAYYIGYLRGRMAHDARTEKATFTIQGQHKRSLDMLYFISFWGTLGLLFLVGIFLLSPNGPVDATDFFVMGTILVTIPFVGLSAMLLNIVLVIDAANRPQDQWEKTNFLRMLNPWSGVIGMRKYYVNFLRPDLLREKGTG